MLADPTARGLAAEIELRAFLAAIDGRIPLEILDAGCGPGFHGRRLLRKGHRVTFADVSQVMLARAQSSTSPEDVSRASFVEADIRHLRQFGARSFDAVVSGGTVVSDCGNPGAALVELRRVLRENGTLGFSVRNIEGPQQKGKRQQVIENGGGGFDWWFFSVESITGLCNQVGLAVSRVCPVLMESPSSPPTDDFVQRHLEAKNPNQWRNAAWELFVIAKRKARRSPCTY